MSALKWVLFSLVAGYVGLAALLYLAQRAMMYFPDSRRVAPAEAGLAADEVELATADGERIVAWHVPPRDRRPVVVYFHGNGGNLSYRARRFRALTSHGFGLMAVSYRGYGGSSGRPSEDGLLTDARAAYEEASRRYPGRVVLWGESLGTAVAVALAADRAVKGVILEAPFTSTLALATSIYPIFPVRWLMKDQFRSDLRIGRVRAPVLVMHGARDRVVPIAYGERLFALIAAPKQFARFPDGDHEDLDDHGGAETVRAFLDRLD